jgi:hypothetical protein
VYLLTGTVWTLSEKENPIRANGLRTPIRSAARKLIRSDKAARPPEMIESNQSGIQELNDQLGNAVDFEHWIRSAQVESFGEDH